MEPKKKLINLLGRPLKIYRNVDDGSFIFFPVPNQYPVSDATQDVEDQIQIDEFICDVNVVEVSVPAAERGIMFIVPEYVAAAQSRSDLLYPTNLREDEQGRSYWANGLALWQTKKVVEISPEADVTVTKTPSNKVAENGNSEKLVVPPVI